MKKIVLGRTGIEVTELCFGALPMGPAQKNMPDNESAGVVAEALRLGVNFIDTAQTYRTYEPIRLAMEKTGTRPVIATKSPAATYEDMEAAILEAREKLNIDVIDIFLLHAARPEDNIFETRSGAFRCLLDYRQKSLIKAVGISTHKVQTGLQAAKNPEIDIVFPILNKTGMGILGGTREDMENAVQECLSQNKGVYLMKALAGGNLIDDYEDAIRYVRCWNMPIALGMVSLDEVNMNVRCFNDEDVSEQAGNMTKADKKFYIVPGLCLRCGKCADVCHSGMINRKENGAFSIDVSQCLRCGYCVEACKQFAIRMI